MTDTSKSNIKQEEKLNKMKNDIEKIDYINYLIKKGEQPFKINDKENNEPWQSE